MLQIHVTGLFYLDNNRKTHPWGVRACRPKDAKRRGPQREGERESALPPLFICLFLPLGLSYVNWASQESVFSTWGPHSSLGTFLCSIFMGFSLPCLLATAILDSFSIYIYIYIYMYIYICTHIHTHIFFTQAYTYTHIYTHMHRHCKILSTASLFLII